MPRKTKPQAEEEDPFPLDSGCWTHLASVHKCLMREKECDDSDLIALALLQEWAKGELPIIWELTSGDRGRLLPTEESEWLPYCYPALLTEEWSQWLTTEGPLRKARTGKVFYGWGPRVDAIFDAPCPECEESAPAPTPAPAQIIESVAKRGRKSLTRWKVIVAHEWCRIVTDGAEQLTAAGFAVFCEGKINYQPDIREVQRLLSDLRAATGNN